VKVKTCNTCFNVGQVLDGSNPACISCVNYDKWVSRDVFKNIDNHGEAMVGRVIKYDPKDVAFTGTIAGTKTVTTGVKFDKDKPQWSLLPFKALREVVDVLTYGAKKYAPDNWKKVPSAKQRYIDAGFRHFTAYAAGEKLDPETGKSHIAHAICCLLYLLAFEIGEDRG
jgi:hypothetical protein